MRRALLTMLLLAMLQAAAIGDVDYYNFEDDRIVPLGSRAVGTTSVSLVGNDYVLKFVGDETIEYHIERGHSDFDRGILRIVEASSGAVIMKGGQQFRYDVSDRTNPWLPEQVPNNVTVTLLSDRIENDTVILDYQHVYGGTTHQLRYEIGIEGKSLRIRSYSLTPWNTYAGNNYWGFHPSRSQNMPNSRFIRIPYMEARAVIFFGGNWFYSQYVDMNNTYAAERRTIFANEGTSTPKDLVYVRYNRMSDNTINHPVDDTVWATVSSKVEDIFVDVDNYPTSPHRVSATRTAVVRHSANTFASAEAQRRKLHTAGFFNSEAYLWNWHYYYINVNEPTYYPPNPGRGTAASFNSMMAYFASIGTPIGLYYTLELMDQGYVSDCYIFHGEGGGNPSYDPTYCNKNASLGFKGGWNTSTPLDQICGPGLGHPSHVQALNHVLFYLLREYKLVHENLSQQTLSYIDAKHNLPINHNIDQEAGTDKVNNIRDGILALKALFTFQKAMTGGPLLGEGTGYLHGKADLEYSGYTDGIRRQLIAPTGVEDKDWYIMPDYELKVIRPRTLHHGMGVETRYAGFPLTQARQDIVRCAEISYGHGIYIMTNGDVPNDFLQDPDELRAYYQITADLQPQFATAGSVEVGYLSGGSFVDLKQAVIDNVDFSNPRLRILYDNGLEIYANHNDVDWVYSVAGETFTIPKDGWVAYNATTGYLNFSAQPAGYGYRFDYVVYPGKYEMIDGRGVSTSYGGITGTDLKIVWANGYTVEETGTFPGDFTITGTMPTPDPAEAPGPLPRPPANDASANFRHLPGLYMWFYRAYDDSITVPVDRPFWSKFNRYPELDFDESMNRYFYRYEPTVRVSANTMRPGNGVDAVRGWVAYAPGQVRVTGNVAKQGGYTGGNGAEARIRDDFEGAILWQQTIAANDTTGYDIDLLVPVGTGDILLFEVDALGDSTDDSVSWAPVITYVDPPEAEFSAQPRVGGAPLAVQFTDESQGQVDTWEWDFGDLGTSFAQNPSHIYVSPGSYEVTLTVTGPTGQGQETKAGFIHVLGQASGVMIKNQGGAVAAAFTPVGDLLLKGALSAGASPSPSGRAGELVIKNGSGQVVALISPSGDVEIAGAVNELQDPPLSPASSAFVVKDGTGKVVSYIDSAGNLYLLGGLVEGWL